MAALRKVLNEDQDVIKTIHGRGYMFTGEVTTISVGPEALARPRPRSTPPLLDSALTSNLPVWSSPRRLWTDMTARDDKAQPTVVVIDDDPDVREALRGLLRTVGLRVELFASVQEFLDRAPADLPGCGGFVFQGGLAGAIRRVPIIFTRGQADARMPVRAMKGGAVEFLTKLV